MINEAICEGCGHCGEISNCMSVHPVETPFGRKTRIHQESCNFDLTCVDGNCPAFVEIEIDPSDVVEKAIGGASYATDEVPGEPVIPEAANVLIVGIGGTGVVTVSQVLSTAAMLDDRVATSLDQTGLAQKGGQVISNLHIGDDSYDGSAKLSSGDADTMLIFDVVGGALPAVLNRARPGETVAIVSTSKVPTGNMVTDTSNEAFPAIGRFRASIDAATSADQNVWVDAEAIGRYVFASQPAANMVLAGAAYQLGRLPVSSGSIERAIELNGVAVESNRAAFRLGRRIAANPTLADALAEEARVAAPQAPYPTPEVTELVAMLKRPTSELVDLLHWRLPELIAWGDRAWARSYMDVVAALHRAEAAFSEVTPLTEAGARYLYKFMTYKDEYEVARLALSTDMGAIARARFGEHAKLSFKLMPPTLKSAGYGKKIAVPEAAGKATFKSLLKTKRLRGTKLDPFGRTEERTIERQLIEDYRALLSKLTEGLTPENQAERVAVAELADVVRGFDDIKLANVKRYRDSLAEAGWA